jgi:lipid-A-disaccharide synthase-like uncharacterized protein
MSGMFGLSAEHVWLAIGFMGQTLFFSRFLIQWIVSERKGESVIPRAFWYFSLGGGIFLLAYSVWRSDPVFITGQAVGLLVYARNLYFIHRGPKSATAS